MEIQPLIDAGLTKTEAKVYLELARIGETSIGNVIKSSGLHRGTVYNVLNNLAKKGFISFIDKDGKRYYKISGEKIFSNIFEQKKKTIESEEKNLEKLFSEFNRLKTSSAQEVDVFYGTESFKTLFLEVYDSCKKTNSEYLFQGRGGEIQDTLGEAFYKYSQKLKKKMKIKCRAILDLENRKHSYHKYVIGSLKYLTSKSQSPVSFWIYGDTVLIVLFGAKPLTSIRIKSEGLSDSFRGYFEYLWSISKNI